MRAGVKPSTLSTAISVRRSLTLMLMAMAITNAMPINSDGTTSHLKIQSRSRYESKNAEEPEEAVSHLTAGWEYNGEDMIWLVSLPKDLESGTRSQTISRLAPAAGCFLWW